MNEVPRKAEWYTLAAKSHATSNYQRSILTSVSQFTWGRPSRIAFVEAGLGRLSPLVILLSDGSAGRDSVFAVTVFTTVVDISRLRTSISFCASIATS